MIRHIVVLVALVGLLAGIGVHLWLRDGKAEQLLPIEVAGDKDISKADLGSDFTLIDHTGKERKLSEFRGKVVALFFGYTHCPDVCPATLATLHVALRELGDAAQQVQVLFVSVDPVRDSPPVMTKYVAKFDPRFVGLTGSEAAVDVAANAFKASYRRYEERGANYPVVHPTGVYLLDRQGRARILAQTDGGAKGLAAELRLLLDLT